MVDITKVRKTAYDVTWNGQDLGGLNNVDVSKLQMLLEPVKVGSLGNVKLDDRYLGLEDGAEIKIEIREVTRVRLEQLHPWFAGTTGTGTIELGPVPGTLLASQYAHALVLHPRDKGDTHEDVTLYKTVPVQIFDISRDGMKDDLWAVVFRVYPDLSKLSTSPPTNPYGTIG